MQILFWQSWCAVEWVGHDRKADKEHDKDCVEEEFQLVRARVDRGCEGDWEDVGMEWSNTIIQEGAAVYLQHRLEYLTLLGYGAEFVKQQAKRGFGKLVSGRDGRNSRSCMK